MLRAQIGRNPLRYRNSRETFETRSDSKKDSAQNFRAQVRTCIKVVEIGFTRRREVAIEFRETVELHPRIFGRIRLYPQVVGCSRNVTDSSTANCIGITLGNASPRLASSGKTVRSISPASLCSWQLVRYRGLERKGG